MKKRKKIIFVLLCGVMGFAIGRLFFHLHAINVRETDIIDIPNCEIIICDDTNITIKGVDEVSFEAENVDVVTMPEGFPPTVYLVTNGYGKVKDIMFYLPCDQKPIIVKTI